MDLLKILESNHIVFRKMKNYRLKHVVDIISDIVDFTYNGSSCKVGYDAASLGIAYYDNVFDDMNFDAMQTIIKYNTLDCMAMYHIIDVCDRFMLKD